MKMCNGALTKREHLTKTWHTKEVLHISMYFHVILLYANFVNLKEM